MKNILISSFMVMALLFAVPAKADCTSPAGINGSMNWNGTAYEYCNGTTWTAFAAGGGSTDIAPDSYSFTNATGQGPGVVVSSNTITISGLDVVPVVAAVTGAGSPQINIGGSGWVSAGVLMNGQTLQVRLTSANTASTARAATVTVGTGTTSWSVTTGAVSPGSQNFTSSGTFTVPSYNNLTITVKGAGRGGTGATGSAGGYYWNNYGGCAWYPVAGSAGSAGSVGGNSNFASSTAVFAKGGGNTPASSGGTVTAGAGGAGGSGGGGTGTAGDQTVKTWANGDSGYPVPGTSVTVTVGTGGSGGAGGAGGVGTGNPYMCYCGYSACSNGSQGASGNTGSNGSVATSWN